MGKFNQTKVKPAVQSPIQTERTPSGRTHEGGPGYARDAKSELFLLAVSNMVGERTFYESADNRDERYERLVHEVAVADPEWTAGFLGWLRGEGNMRSASLVGALEAARAMVKAKLPGSRQLVASVLQRADEPGEALAYWTSRYGRAIPKPVKRGIADAVGRLYNEYGLLKYDTDSKGFRFADVLDLVHPSPVAPWQGVLFKYALDRRHDRGELGPETGLPTVHQNAVLRTAAGMGEFGLLLDADRLKAAGMTWEDVLSLAGSKVDKGKLWAALIPSMGYMALLRNLRNFDQAGVTDEIAETVANRLADVAQVAKSRQFPFRFLSAYRNAPNLRWSYPLEKALNASLANVPTLKGRTLILVDQSPSMFPGYYFSTANKSDISLADQAKIFGSALAVRAESADLVQYGGQSELVKYDRAESVLKLLDRFKMIESTATAAAAQRWFAKHDRVVIVTDEQTTDNLAAVLPATVPVYTWNLAGYKFGHGPSRPHWHTFGGLTDAAFRMVPLLEAGANAAWPWIK